MNKTKKAIFTAAIKIFSRDGYNGATMDDIALAAGVAKGTLYYHFKSKEEIFKYIISEGMKLMNETVEEETQKFTSSLDKLKAICRVQLAMVYENKDFFKVIMSQLWGQEIRQVELREMLRTFIMSIEKYIKEAMETGVVRKGESYFMAYTFFGTLCSAAIYEVINEKLYQQKQVTEDLIQYILKGIAIV